MTGRKPVTVLGAEITADESDRLWWQLVRGIAAVSDEIVLLSLAPERVRDRLYGKGCLASYQALRADLACLADNDIPPTAASWASRLAGNPEEGNPLWHDSETGRPMSLETMWRSLMPGLRAASRGLTRLTSRR
jgi:hypothetical protein